MILGINMHLEMTTQAAVSISTSAYITSRYYKPYLSGSPRDRPSKERQLGKKMFETDYSSSKLSPLPSVLLLGDQDRVPVMHWFPSATPL